MKGEEVMERKKTQISGMCPDPAVTQNKCSGKSEHRRIPKCWEEHEPPPGYFDPVDPCKKQPSMFLDFRGLLDYAKSVHKDITELSYDEVCPFLGNRKE